MRLCIGAGAAYGKAGQLDGEKLKKTGGDILDMRQLGQKERSAARVQRHHRYELQQAACDTG